MRTFTLFILVILLMTSCNSSPDNTDYIQELRHYKLAMAQMKVVGGEQDQNLTTATERIKEAAENGAKIALLPEALDFGWTHSSAKEGAGPIPGGKSFEALSKPFFDRLDIKSDATNAANTPVPSI